MLSHHVSLILVGLLDKFTYGPFSEKQVDWISDMLTKKYKYKTTKVMIIFKWSFILLYLKPKDCIGLILCKEMRYLFRKRICCPISDHAIKSLAYAGTFSWIFGHFNCWEMNWNLENRNVKNFWTLHSWLSVVVLIELYYPTSIWINKTLLKLSQCVIKGTHIVEIICCGTLQIKIIYIFVVNSINYKVTFLLYFKIDFIPCLMF